MQRRSIVHVFLALLLLLTQQVGVTHVYTHWSDVDQQATQLTDEEHAEHRKRVAAHKVCAECVSVAQMGAAIASSAMTLALSTVSAGPVAVPSTLSACERTTCFFQSRAPPLA
jgi:hypothetical protein